MKKLTKSELIVLVLVIVGLATAVTLTVQSLTTTEAPAGPSEAERKAAFEEAVEHGNLSLEDARHWQVVNDGKPGTKTDGNDGTD
ncbi:MAG: hypothetical protein JSW52_07260 [Candidatus Coatesbacteria bacterium]|nr:MAG: hypothetical protein JSW52_07260 [Candidatus Coatesbacteria bacterium]